MQQASELNFVWMIEARSKSQQLLLRLHNFKQERHHKLNNFNVRSAFALFVGIAFSLRRAASLPDAKREAIDIVDGADRLLVVVLKENAVGFRQDRDTRVWMAGYYLNGARLRLFELRKIIGSDRLENCLKNLQGVESFEGKEPTVVWDRRGG